ncbi:hypothetical protein IQ07DRAFT_590029 [Pyrenochaeta sp. DS3sAY3a]|nr:hypothetical protein IQ07DRAFT_590029 [Pyrenochaeta sp. DS3sAY3a]
MSLLRTLARTSVVSNTANAAHARPLLSFLWPSLQAATPQRTFKKKAITRPSRGDYATDATEDVFIKALALAGSCPKHARHISTHQNSKQNSARHPKTQQRGKWRFYDRREFGTSPECRGPFNKVRKFAEHELKALVDYYGIKLDTRPEEPVPDGGSLVWNVGDAHQPWPLRDEADTVHVKRLEKLLEDDEAPHDQVFETYRKLPTPGVVYLTIETIRTLLRHLSIVERPTPLAMQRFLSVLDDMKAAHIHIIESEWTSAIHLAGHATGYFSTDGLQSALYIWRDMEQRAGLKATFVTLNVLFTVAVKAGKYTLAETFMKELQARNLPFYRHFRISLLYYYGVLQNGDLVRKTYQELVSAGDVVDTVVLNAVIAALIRAGEPSAAEHVFERMKRLNAERLRPAPGHVFFRRNWRDRRQLSLMLTHEARQYKAVGDDEQLKQLQDYAPVAPDSRTYALLIRHHAGTIGDYDRVNELLQEMRYNSVDIEGTIFIVIFHGFNTFGGARYTSWTHDRLEKLWKQYLKALKNDPDRTWLSSMAVIAALKAFSKCADEDRTLRAWEEIRPLWHPNERDLESVMTVLRKLVPNRDHGFFDENI